MYLLLRSRALFNAVRAAYPGGRVRWRDVWGGYMVGYAVNNVIPLGGGNVAQLFLIRTAIADSSYPTIAAALSTGVIFDWLIGLVIMGFAFTQGVFPKPPDFSKLPGVRHQLLRLAHALHAVLPHAAGHRLRARLRAFCRHACVPSGSGSGWG